MEIKYWRMKTNFYLQILMSKVERNAVILKSNQTVWYVGFFYALM